MERHDISHFEETRKIDVCIITHHFPYLLLVCVLHVSVDVFACNLHNSNPYTNDTEANPKVLRYLCLAKFSKTVILNINVSFIL